MFLIKRAEECAEGRAEECYGSTLSNPQQSQAFFYRSRLFALDVVNRTTRRFFIKSKRAEGRL